MLVRNRFVQVMLIVFLSLGSFLASSAQVAGQEKPSDCSEIVASALSILDDVCTATGRNEACYGHFTLQAVPQPDVVSFNFDEEGDIEDVINIQSLRLSSLDTSNENWGVAMMRLEADSESASSGLITVLLFGDVELGTTTTSFEGIETVIDAGYNANVRLAPSTSGNVVLSLAPGSEVLVTGRLADDSWVSIRIPDTETIGWISSILLDLSFDLEALPIVDSAPRFYGPMRAIYLESGFNDAACKEQPNSGILIQTPEGSARVTYLINEVNIQFDSTIYLQSETGNAMTVSVIDGTATVSAAGVTQFLPAGTQLSVPMDENHAPSGAPGVPEPYDMDAVAALPVGSLGHPVTISEPPTITPPPPDATPDAQSTPVPGQPTTAPVPGQPTTAPVPTAPPPEPTTELIAVCHNGTTMWLDPSAVQGHLNHGDTLGECP